MNVTKRGRISFGNGDANRVVITAIKSGRVLERKRSAKSREEIDKSMAEYEVPELDRNVGAPSFRIMRLWASQALRIASP